MAVVETIDNPAVNVASLVGEDAKTLQVAFASDEGDIVDQHFGSASAFYLYTLSAEQAVCQGVRRFDRARKDGNEDKLKPKMAFLVGADVVYCGSIGGSATRQLITLGVTPIQVKGGPDVEDLLQSLQQQMTTTPEPWLANIMRRKQTEDEDRFDRFADEEWAE